MKNRCDAVHHLTCDKCDEQFYSEDSLQGHVVVVHAVAHPQICENCDKEFLNTDSLQGHVADGHENGDPVFEDQTEAQYKSGHCLFGITVA